jgi:hypothetical protein
MDLVERYDDLIKKYDDLIDDCDCVIYSSIFSLAILPIAMLITGEWK